MPATHRLISHLAAIPLLFGFLATATLTFAADKEKVLYSFRNGHDGNFPEASLIFDATGNLYGTTVSGGRENCGYDTGCGTVFRLTPDGTGRWKETVLHRFSGQDGGGPSGTLILDGMGNLYGTVSGGQNENGTGNGNVFELSPEANGKWTIAVLHAFTGGSDGGSPYGGVIFDAAGNLYGTTIAGGSYSNGLGTVFELVPDGSGKWKEVVLYSFKNDGKDGTAAVGGLIFDAAGNLYGTTSRGGVYGSVCQYGCGTVFELTPGSNGQWMEKVLHSFNEEDGYSPENSLILDVRGNLYGTTYAGGSGNAGVLFELFPEANGKWKEKILHRFSSFHGNDGRNPSSNVIFDPAGNLYGTTASGGTHSSRNCNHNCGTVFKVSPSTDGEWVEKVLYNFNGTTGWYPQGGVIFDAKGNLYGATLGGGFSQNGTVYELKP